MNHKIISVLLFLLVTLAPITTLGAGININGLLLDVASTVTAAGTTTLTNASNQNQRFTGSTTQTIVLPDATTLLRAGWWYKISNDSTGALTLQDDGLNTISTIEAGAFAWIDCHSISTSNGTWDVQSAALTVYSNPGSGTDSEMFGVSVSADGLGGTAFGKGADADGARTTAMGRDADVGAGAADSSAFGYGATTAVGSVVVIGSGAVVTQNRSVAVGFSAEIRGEHSVVIGENSESEVGANDCVAIGRTAKCLSGFVSTIALGSDSQTGVSNSMTIGSAAHPITTFWFGEGFTSATPQDITINGTTATGTDTAAGDLVIASGKSTGNATVTEIRMSTPTVGGSGSTAQTLAVRASIDVNGIRSNMGVFAMDEVATPGATASIGKIYTKTDNVFYFQDGAGTEHEASLPTTTKGDSIFRGASNVGRLAVGANGEVIIADSTQSLGVKWGSAPASAASFAINSISTSSTVVINQYVIAINTITVTLPTAVGVDGQSIIVYNDGSGLVSIATTSSQTIGDSTVTGLDLYVEGIIRVISDGADWQIGSAKTNWHIDVEIGGANPTFSTLVGAWTEITDGGLDMTVTSGDSTTADVEIACGGANAPEGLTCTGNESVGVAFKNPLPGNYEVCASVPYSVDSATPTTTFNLIETPISATTETQTPVTIFSTRFAANETHMFFCAVHVYATSAQRVVRLMRRKDSATGTSNLLMDRSSAKGVRAYTFTVKQI